MSRGTTAAPSAGLRKGKTREGRAAGAESEPLHGQPPGHMEGALVILPPEEADGSLLTAPGEVFASLAFLRNPCGMLAVLRIPSRNPQTLQRT